MSNMDLYQSKKGTVESCLGLIKSDDVIVLTGDCNAPISFGSNLHTIAPNVENVTVFKDFKNYFKFAAAPDMNGHINTQGFFMGKDMREGQPYGNSSFFVADMCCNGNFITRSNPNIYVAAVSPMDENGNFQIGLCNMWEREPLDYVLANHGTIILEVNAKLPRVRGGIEISINDVTALYEADNDMPIVPASTPSEDEIKVAQYVRSLMHDGDCVQFGIGSLPNAIAAQCMDLQDLGLHTEMITSALGEMVRKGVITGERKNYNKGEHIFTFSGGDQALYDTIAADSRFRITAGSDGCNPMNIMKNDNMVSVNTCIEIDLTGQIASEAVGPKQFSGSGGAFDFAYGALMSKGGRGIMAFTTRTKKGYSKIKSVLGAGSVVTIPRNYADYIVTEYGIAPLRGRTIRQRVNNLIAVAHPDDRAQLRQEAEKLMFL